jgi:hypothetical protein
VEDGGILIAFQNYPQQDEDFKPSSLIGFENPRSKLFEFKRRFSVQLATGRPRVEMFSSVLTFPQIKTGKITTLLGSYGLQTIGYCKKIGKGKIIHLGVEPSSDLLFEILNWLGISRAAHSPTPGIKTALFQRNKHYYLIAVNNGQEDKSAGIDVQALLPRFKRVIVENLIRKTREVYSSERLHPLSIEIPRKDGCVLKLSPVR